MQSHLGRLTVDTNAARSHHSRAISEPTIDRPQFEEPVLVPSTGNSLRPRSSSNYADAAASPRLNLTDASPYQLTSSSIAHLSPAAHTILLNNVRQEDVQVHSPVAYSPVADDTFQHSPIYPASTSTKAWSVYQGEGPKHDRPGHTDLDFRPRSAVSEPGRDLHDHADRSNMSAFEYMFPASAGHFSQGPHYDTVLQSSFQGTWQL